jgi:hypothetical protein
LEAVGVPIADCGRMWTRPGIPSAAKAVPFQSGQIFAMCLECSLRIQLGEAFGEGHFYAPGSQVQFAKVVLGEGDKNFAG